MSSSDSTISLPQLICALSDALDLVGVDDVAHGKRVGLMASDCGAAFGFERDECRFLIDAGLLHDIGVSSTRTHQHLLQQFDWENSEEHAIIGHDLLKAFAPLARMAVPVRYHHTRWELLQALVGQSLTPQQALEANLLFLVDRVDTFAAPHYASDNLFDHTQAIRERIRLASGTYFNPALVQAFLDASAAEAFWLGLEGRAVRQRLLAHVLGAPTCSISSKELLELAKIFAQIVDAKSHFTHEHSIGVARLSVYLGRRLGLSGEDLSRLQIAALLHDLGKLRVPDEILEKPGALNAHERGVMNTHSYETHLILASIEGFEDIARIAAYHHEVPDGTGYPFHLKGDALSLPARILRVADVFQALAQNRPYRRGMSADEIKKGVSGMASRGQLDATVTSVVTDDLSTAMREATGQAI